MLYLKTAKSVPHIQKYPSKIDCSRQGSLTVVAVIFVGILLSCLMFQLAAYKQEMGSINRITEHERFMRHKVVQERHEKHHNPKRAEGHK
jgi:MFS superfamily sulfate permease-like transporter